PSLNIQKTIKPGDNIIEFTPGDKDIAFSCWMGMIRGVIKVSDNLDSVDTSKSDSSIPAPSSGMPCCTGTGAASAKPSIYGNDLSQVPTDRLIKKASISGRNQIISVKGIGYEFEPLIIAANKNYTTKITLDLNSFDNPEGKFQIIDSKTNQTLTSFDGKKGVVNVTFDTHETGVYLIIKDGSLLSVIDVVDNLNTTDLNSIRSEFLNN
ncbi:MAG: heavy metal transport/detoxification protein, partial [Solirubrobacterales bacterium]